MAVEDDNVFVLLVEGTPGDWDLKVYYTNNATSPSWSSTLIEHYGGWLVGERLELVYDPANNALWAVGGGLYGADKKWWRGTYDSETNSFSDVYSGALTTQPGLTGDAYALNRTGSTILMAYGAK